MNGAPAVWVEFYVWATRRLSQGIIRSWQTSASSENFKGRIGTCIGSHQNQRQVLPHATRTSEECCSQSSSNTKPPLNSSVGRASDRQRILVRGGVCGRQARRRLRKSALPKTWLEPRTGSDGEPICRSANGALFGRITRTTVMCGIRFRMRWRSTALFAGARMACWDGRIASAVCASVRFSGMGKTAR